jgi:hypothetical protein
MLMVPQDVVQEKETATRAFTAPARIVTDDCDRRQIPADP